MRALSASIAFTFLEKRFGFGVDDREDDDNGEDGEYDSCGTPYVLFVVLTTFQRRVSRFDEIIGVAPHTCGLVRCGASENIRSLLRRCWRLVWFVSWIKVIVF